MSDEEPKSIPVAAARAAVQASGELEALDGPHYLAHDEADWRSYFIPDHAAVGHPLLGRVVITRKGQAPREVVISWAEYAEELALEDPAWAAKREQKPMTIFGAEVERHAYRVVFADILAAIQPEPARPGTYVNVGSLTEPNVVERNWHADIDRTKTPEEMDALAAEMREAKAFTGQLSIAIQQRLREIADEQRSEPRTPDEIVLPESRTATPSPAQVAAKVKPLTVKPTPNPERTSPRRSRKR